MDLPIGAYSLDVKAVTATVRVLQVVKEECRKARADWTWCLDIADKQSLDEPTHGRAERLAIQVVMGARVHR